jgi:hypothetical protein
MDIKMNKEEFLVLSKKIKEQIKIYNGGLKEFGKDMVHNAIKPVFDKYPELNNVSWRAFTPYFNDGDECRFNSYHDYPYINDYNPDYGDEAESSWMDEAWEDVTEALSFLSNDDARTIFGNHVKVTVTRDGVSVDDYTSHD